MKVPVSWLREYVEVDATTAEIADRLAIATGEVERISFRGVADVDGNYGLYRVGRVLEAGKHPNADRLQLCRVDVGEEEPRQIVCGAWNFGAGATVAVALPGAVLPDGRTLERASLRGTVSDGMILSESELELSGDHAGILVLPEPWEPGTPLGDVLPLGEVHVDDLALDGRHRLERDRVSALQRVRRRPVGHVLERAPAPLAIARRVDHHLLALALDAAPENGVDKVLDRVDGVAALADHQAEVGAGQRRRDDLVALHDVDLARGPERRADMLQHLAELRGR